MALNLKEDYASGLKMRQCVLCEAGSFAHSVVDTPGSPEAGWALVRTGVVGMCGTDFHAFHGKQNFFSFPRVLGHEIGCTVVALGAGAENVGVHVGDKCAVVPYWGCGTCVACHNGKSNCCTDIQVIGVHADGAMRDYFLVPVDKLVPSKLLSLEQLALVETLCIGAHAVSRAAPRVNENALIIGAGPIGMAAAQFAIAEGLTVVVADINDSRLDFVRKNAGVQHTLNTKACDDVPTQLKEIFDGDLPTVVFDATGHLDSMQNAFNFVAHGGRIVFIGHTKEKVCFENPLFHSRELSIIASRNALPADFARVIELIEAGKLDVSSWVTHRCTMENFEDSFMKWMKPETGVIKGMVLME